VGTGAAEPDVQRGMTARLRLTAVAALAAGVLLTAGCTGDPKPATTSAPRDNVAQAGPYRLVAFDTCQDALAGLKRAAKESVGPYGFGQVGPPMPAAGSARAQAASGADAAKSAADAAPGTEYSGTNTHEAGVDEPDLVKTDGRRIVTITRGVLHVVDPATRKVTGKLDLGTDAQDPIRWDSPDLLLSGDRALVLVRAMAGQFYDVPGAAPDKPAGAGRIPGSRLLLVDLSGSPRLVSSYTMDGSLVDARQVGATARVVVRSAPRITFPYAERATDAQRLAASRQIIDKARLGDWLPQYAITTDGRTERGRVECGSVSRPETYSAASMLTVLTFDLGAQKLDDGQPVTVVADGDTVYSNGPSLYVANYQRWQAVAKAEQGVAPARPRDPRTEIYKFDTSGPGRPKYVAAGALPGYLLNQYALSEWDGHLRAVTTTFDNRESTVYVLHADGQRLVQTGKVGGLGKGERIYAVRFVGAVGYVVTFRRTDPLYTVDLSDPAKPRVAGELKMTGYSSYLHPVGDGRLVGIGQEASEGGRVQGTQVSLFDVSDLDNLGRLAQYHVKNGYSDAENDPHAFLYWPADRLLVVPLSVHDRASNGTALVLRVGDNKLTEVGVVTQQADLVRRALVIDRVLWTASNAGLQATDMSTLDKLAWVPLT
jgi:uncharacterized secreted protein with C-terminal beta-propeller domain